MTHVYCLDCDRTIILHSDIRVGDQVTCSSCDTEFQIVNITPPEIEWLYDDYDDDAEDDDSLDAYEEDDDEDEEEEEWSHLIAKQRRYLSYTMDSSQRRARDTFHE